jgi:hypothetical protein
MQQVYYSYIPTRTLLETPNNLLALMEVELLIW